jgi:hypothetical protein
VLALNWLEGSLACGGETSYCAHGPPRRWQGRVFTADGRPADRALVTYSFASMDGRTGSEPRAPVELRSDGQGRYCFRWPVEKTAGYVELGEVRSGAGPDPRFEAAATTDFLGQVKTGPILISPDAAPETRIAVLPGTQVRLSSKLWIAHLDAAERCPEPAVHPKWDRVDDLKDNWRYRLIKYLSVAAVAISLIGLVAPRRLRLPLAVSGLFLGAVDALLFVLIWITRTL